MALRDDFFADSGDDGGGVMAPAFPVYGNMPLNAQLSPYLNIDPGIFRQSQPQYIMPEGAAPRRGQFELAFGQIGGGVLTGFVLGGARGLWSATRNPEVASEAVLAIWRNRVINVTMSSAAAAARPFGVALFFYSGFGVLLSRLRGHDDELNPLAAGAATGALLRNPWTHGVRRAAVGTGLGAAVAAAFVFSRAESRNRALEIITSLRS